MKTGAHRLLVMISVFLFLLVSSPSAFAYLDPSTGSMVVSAIVGLAASIALALKTYWYRIKGFFKKDRQQSVSPKSPHD